MAQIQVHSFLDSDKQEAVLEIIGKETRLLAYSWLSNIEREDGEVRLSAFMCEDIVRSDSLELPRQYASDSFSYRVSAEVVDASEAVVKIEDIVIELDAQIPKDISNGEYVSFEFTRLDYID